MFISVDLPAPFSPSSAWTSPWRRSKSTLSFASTPGNRFVIPRSSSRGASAMGPAILSSRAETARQLLRGRPSPQRRRRRDARVEPANADRSARRAEDEVLATVVDVTDRIAGDEGRRHARQLEVGDAQRDVVLLVR